MTSTTRQLLASARMLLALTALLGVLYPAAVWAVGRVAFPGQADGSLVRRDGVVVGSSLLGQDFRGDRWFTGRPSTSAYAGATSGGSNLAASSADQVRAVRERASAYRTAYGTAAPADALTASASGLDPHISPANAAAQVHRVAAARGLPDATVARLVEQHTQGRVLGFLGEPRVNVLELNLALETIGR